MIRSRLFVLAALSCALGCRSLEPPFSNWNACLVRRGSVQWVGKRVDVVAGPNDVIYVHARWGESSALRDYVAGELFLELPAGVTPGTEIVLGKGGPQASYAEGGEELYYFAEGVLGRVRVVRADAEGVVLDVDAMTDKITIDLSKRGSIPLRGRITAAPARSIAHCP